LVTKRKIKLKKMKLKILQIIIITDSTVFNFSSISILRKSMISLSRVLTPRFSAFNCIKLFINQETLLRIFVFVHSDLLKS